MMTAIALSTRLKIAAAINGAIALVVRESLRKGKENGTRERKWDGGNSSIAITRNSLVVGEGKTVEIGLGEFLRLRIAC
jgi:hypothetical protein